MESSKLHAAILSSPGMGHLVPVLVLGKRLVTHHNFHVTVLVVTAHTSAAESQLLHPASSPELLNIVELPPVDISRQVEPDATVVTQLCVMMKASKPAIRSALLRCSPTMFIVDIFGSESFEIADELRIPRYVYVASTAWFTALTMYSPVLDKDIVGQYVDQKEPLIIPGCKPVRAEDVVDPMLDRNNREYYEYIRMGIEYSFSDGILMNTWEDLEHISLEALRKNKILRSVVKAPVYPIGPLTKAVEPKFPKSELLEWLDKQPSESVLYVSFGSGGTLSAVQITELAWGLEQSQQRFVWVVRPPVDGHADASFFMSGDDTDGSTPDFLPDEFVSRTHNLGVVVPLWAPQMEILSHPSVGGFLSHCGWNSTLESLTNGVPMIAWPLYAEQRLNATMLTEELGVAVRPKVLPTKKVVMREAIEEMVRNLMDYERGKGMRERVKKLKINGENALIKGGYSYNSMCQVIKDSQSVLESKNL